ncbi:MAG: hypothetical protein ACRCTF_01670 [Bacteroidales bacterium]
MRSKDFKAVETAKVLVVGEDSNLQWSETVSEYVMFADYYFRPFPADHGERARNVEAKTLFDHILYLTHARVKPEEIFFTNLCRDYVEQAPKGKRTFIPEEKAIRGLSHVKWILEENPSIRYVIVLSLQANYWMQQLGFYGEENEKFLHGAQPRRVGEESFPPFYQPVDGKSFRMICGEIYDAKGFDVKVIPALQAKDYPLKDRNFDLYAEAYEKIREEFEECVL